MKTKARVIAMYLPQYHPIPENDAVWGKGFTEWSNVVKARPLYPGHYQPKLPADLGFYDLRLSEIREQQALLAKDAGIEGFMYWHYWFGKGRMLLERPFQEVVSSGKPDFPFCLGWANHSWMTKTWRKGSAFQKNPMIMEMLYSGKEDYLAHFNYCLPAFKDKRYIRIDNKPIFVVYAPMDMPDAKEFIATWRQLASENGLEGIHFVGLRYGRYSIDDILGLGFDAVNNRDSEVIHQKYDKFKFVNALKNRMRKIGIPAIYDYEKISSLMLNEECRRDDCYPTIVTGYDRTARAGGNTVIYTNYTPQTFRNVLSRLLSFISSKSPERNLIFLQSWNEWGEGNYIEPDVKYGHAFLNVLKEELINHSL